LSLHLRLRHYIGFLSLTEDMSREKLILTCMRNVLYLKVGQIKISMWVICVALRML